MARGRIPALDCSQVSIQIHPYIWCFRLLFSGAKASVDVSVKQPFQPLLQYLFSNFLLFHSGFFFYKQIENAHKNKWMEIRTEDLWLPYSCNIRFRANFWLIMSFIDKIFSSNVYKTLFLIEFWYTPHKYLLIYSTFCCCWILSHFRYTDCGTRRMSSKNCWYGSKAMMPRQTALLCIKYAILDPAS